MPGYNLQQSFEESIKYYSNATAVSIQNFYTDLWNGSFSTDYLITDLMVDTSSSLYFEFDANKLEAVNRVDQILTVNQ